MTGWADVWLESQVFNPVGARVHIPISPLGERAYRLK